jgi:hypothetical protein
MACSDITPPSFNCDGSLRSKPLSVRIPEDGKFKGILWNDIIEGGNIIEIGYRVIDKTLARVVLHQVNLINSSSN